MAVVLWLAVLGAGPCDPELVGSGLGLGGPSAGPRPSPGALVCGKSLGAPWGGLCKALVQFTRVQSSGRKLLPEAPPVIPSSLGASTSPRILGDTDVQTTGPDWKCCCTVRSQQK